MLLILNERAIIDNVYHIIVKPPSGATACPTINPAAGLHSHNTVEAISSSLPTRAIGMDLIMASICSGASLIAFETIGVSTTPGHIALMRIPLEAYSRAEDLVRPSTPCLAAV